MNEEQARQIKDPSKLPWNLDCFIFVAERFYHALYFLSVPPNRRLPHGGDITAQCWRFNNTPHEWIITQRLRTYAAENQIWGSNDQKTWFCMRLQTDEVAPKALAVMEEVAGGVGLFCGQTPPTVEIVLLNRTGPEVLDWLIKNLPDWLHMKEA